MWSIIVCKHTGIFREIDVTNHNWTISLTVIFLFTNFSCQNRNIPKYRSQCVVIILRCCSFFFSFSLLNNTLKGEGNNIHYTSMWNFIVIISPFTISIKKSQTTIYTYIPWVFFRNQNSFISRRTEQWCASARICFIHGEWVGEVRIPFCSLLKSISYDQKNSLDF